MRAALRSPHQSSNDIHPPRHRHRFVQDGQVPVVVLNPQHRRAEDRTAVADLERAIAAERETRREAETALKQAEELIRQLQTRLAHAELARIEAATMKPEPVEKAAPRKTISPKRSRVKPALAEDKAVEWWMPGWRERLHKPG